MYDDAGRMVSSKLEAEWDEGQQAWMAALEHHEKVFLCHLCGLPKEVCRAYDTDGMVQVDVERCHVTAALGAKQNANHEAGMLHPESLAYSVSIRT